MRIFLLVTRNNFSHSGKQPPPQSNTAETFLGGIKTSVRQVPIQSNSDCQEKVLGKETIESSMLCAGGEGSGTNKVKYNCTFQGLEYRRQGIYKKVF